MVILYDTVLGEIRPAELAVVLDHPRCVEITLPQWSNEVEVHIDDKAKSGLIAVVKLACLGRSVNWQRHLRLNYTRMCVLNPETDERGAVLESEVDAHGGFMPFVVRRKDECLGGREGGG
ncbi:hypothetical protein MMC30_005594 [Trapelia coarctata]|nr:hypothetical protein [Trapelia coarctata]